MLHRPGSARSSRPGLATLEIVMTTGVCVPAAGIVYLMCERAADALLFVLANGVGWPFL